LGEIKLKVVFSINTINIKAMKKIFLTQLMLVIVLLGANAQTNPEKPEVIVDVDTTENDSVEYDLVVLELGFESYYATQRGPEFFTVEYLKNWNYRYCIEWNHRYLSGPQQELYMFEIPYEIRTDYGIEFEHKLYHFFLFFERKYNVRLIPRGKTS
jgi:hypothetical protein